MTAASSMEARNQAAREARAEQRFVIQLLTTLSCYAKSSFLPTSSKRLSVAYKQAHHSDTTNRVSQTSPSAP